MRLVIATPWTRHRAAHPARRLDRLRRLLPDRDRGRRRLVRRHRLGRDAVENHAGHLDAGHPAQPGTAAAGGRRTGRPYRRRPCGRGGRGGLRRPRKTAPPAGCSACREPLARFIAPKGSVAVDGVSLTVNEVEGAQLRREHHPAHRRPSPPSATAAPGDAGQHRNRHRGALRRPTAGVAMTDTAADPLAARLPLLGRGPDRGGAQRPHVHPGR